MVIDANAKLLDTVAEELLKILRRAETHVTDIVEFGFIQSAGEAEAELRLVRNALIVLGEPAAAELCDVIVDDIDATVHLTADVNINDMTVTFLALSDYIERLSTLRAEGQIVIEKQDILHTKAVKYHLADIHKSNLTQAVEQIRQYIQHSDATVIWKSVYPVIRTLKSMVLSQDNYEYLWLMQQLTVRNIKDILHTPKDKTLVLLNEQADYLSKLVQTDETYPLYQEIFPRVTELRGMIRDSQLTSTLNEVYSPPPRRLVPDEDAVSMTFPVARSTIQTISFFVKREIAGTARLFEQAYNNNELNNPDTLAEIAGSLRQVSAAFTLLRFDTGEGLIADALEQLNKTPIDDDVVERFADDIVLLESSLWGLRHIEPHTHLINVTDTVARQRNMLMFTTVETAMMTIADVAMQFFQQTRENITDYTTDVVLTNIMGLAERIHDFQSAVDLIGEQELVANLLRAEQFHLFWANHPNLLESRLATAAYLEVCVAYEIAFDQLHSALDVDLRATKLLQQSHRQLENIVEFNLHQMAEPTYRIYGTENDRLYQERQAATAISEAEAATPDVGDDEVEEEHSEQHDILATPQSMGGSGIGIGDGVGMGGGAMLAGDDDGAESVSLTMGDKPDAGGTKDLNRQAMAYVQLNHDLHSLPDEEIDDELLEIFLDEGKRITDKLFDDIKSLHDSPQDKAILKEVERAYHTLKGSGRMVGLNIFGEFAWQHEEFLRSAEQGRCNLNLMALRLLDESNELLKSVFAENPFVEDKAKLLTQAGKIKAIADRLNSKSDGDKGDVSASSAATAATAADSGVDEAVSASTLSEADITSIAAQVAQMGGQVTPAPQIQAAVNATSNATNNGNDLAADVGVDIQADSKAETPNDHVDNVGADGEETQTPSDTVTARGAFVRKVKDKVASGKVHFDNWKAQDYEKTESFDGLKNDVSDIHQAGETADYADSQAVTQGLSETLETIAENDDIRVDETTAQPIEAAIDDLSRMHNDVEQGGAGSANPDVVEALATTQRQLAAEAATATSGETTTDTAVTARGAFVRKVKDKVASGKVHFDNWKAQDYEKTESFDGLKNDVSDIHQAGETADYADSQAVTQGLLETLETIAENDDIRVDETTAQPIEAAIDDLSRMHNDVEQGGAGSANPDVVEALATTQRQLAAGAATATSGETTTDAAVTASDDVATETAATPRRTFVHKVKAKMASGKAHFDNWKAQDYEKTESFDGLKNDVSDIHQAGEAADYADSQAVTQGLSETLETIAENDDIRVDDATAQPIEAAIDDLSRMHSDVEQGGIGNVNPDVVEALATTQRQLVAVASRTVEPSEVPSDMSSQRGTEAVDQSMDKAADSLGTTAADHVSTADVASTAADLKAQLQSAMSAGKKPHNDAVQQSLSTLQQALSDSAESDAPTWSNELLTAVSQTLKAVDNVDLSLSPSDYQTVNQALNALAEPQKISEQRVADIQSALNDIADGTPARKAKADQVTAFGKNARPELDATDVAHSEWKAAGHAPTEPLSDLIKHVGSVSQKAKQERYEEGEALADAVGDVLTKLDADSIVPKHKLASQIEQAVGELTAEQAGKHGDVSQLPATASALQSQLFGGSALGTSYAQSVATLTPAPTPADAATQPTSDGTPPPYQVDFAVSAAQPISDAQQHYNTWKGEQYQSDVSLSHLSNAVADIHSQAERVQYDDATNLTQSMSDVLSRVDADKVIPSDDVTRTLELGLYELDTVKNKVASGVAAAISQPVISQLQQQAGASSLGEPIPLSADNVVGNDSDTAATLAPEDLVPSQAALSARSQASTSRAFPPPHQIDFIANAAKPISDAQTHYDSWKGEEYRSPTSLSGLSTAVADINQHAEQSHYDDASDLTQSMSDVLSRVDTEKVIPSNKVTKSLELGLQELDVARDDVASGVTAAISQPVISQIRQQASESTLGEPMLKPVDRLAQLAPDEGDESTMLPPDDVLSSQDDVVEQGLINRAAANDALTNATATDEPVADDVISDEVEETVAETPSQDPTAPSQPTTVHPLAAGILPGTTLSDATLSKSSATEKPAVEKATAEGDKPQLSAKVGGQVISPNYQTFAASATRHIDASQEHFFDWKESQFASQSSLNKLSDNVKSISAASKAAAFESAAELTRSVSGILDRVNRENLRPTQQTAEHVEGALSELQRSSTAIQSGQGDKEIQSQIIQSVTRTVMSSDIGQPMDPLTNIHDLLLKMHTQHPVRESILPAEQDVFGFATGDASGIDQAIEKLKEDRAVFAADDPTMLDNSILTLFIDEANAIVEEIYQGLAQPASVAMQGNALSELQRRLHTLKGGAKMAGVNSLGELAHRSEALLVGIAEERILDLSESRALMTETTQIFRDQIQTLRAGVPVRAPLDFFNRLERFIAEQYGRVPDLLPTESDDATVRDAQTAKYQLPKTILVSTDAVRRLLELVAANVTAKAQAEWGYAYFYSHMSELKETMNRIERLSREIEVTTETATMSKPSDYTSAKNAGFDPLEMDRFTKLHQHSRTLAEVTHDFGELNKVLNRLYEVSQEIRIRRNGIQDAIQDVVLSMATTDFSSANYRIQMMVNQVSQRLGKAVNVRIYGAHTTIEKSTLDSLVVVIEHAVRNSLAHGIEAPAERIANGKAAQGQVTLIIRREGPDIWIMIADDGRGVDIERVRQKAKASSDFDESREGDDNYILDHLFRPGFTTASEATQIAGRGIGLDVIHEIVNSLGGEAQISSRLGEGFNLAIRVPYGMSITKAIQVAIGDYHYLIPLNTMKGFVRLSNANYQRFVEGESVYYNYAGIDYRVISPSATRYTKQKEEGKEVPCLLIRVGVENLALVVSGIMDSQEVVIEAGNTHLTQIPGIVGLATVQNSSNVPVLDAALFGRHLLLREARRAADKDATPAGQLPLAEVEPLQEEEPLNLLVVDDSITMRKAAERMLSGDSVKIKTAKNGFDAIDVLQEQLWLPDVILLDIEMPKMDGFEFAEWLRGNEKPLCDIPVIIITSRSSGKHKKRAGELGVSAFLSKPFNKKSVMDAVADIFKDATDKADEQQQEK